MPYGRASLRRTRDGHLGLDLFDIKSILENFIFIISIYLNIKQINGTIKIFGVKRIKEEFQSKFKNYEILFPIIDKNKNISIKNIKRKDPFNFISDFGNNYLDFRSPHANFALKKFYTEICYFSIFPLSYEELTNFDVIYENGDTFITDYIISSSINIYENQTEIILLKIGRLILKMKIIFFIIIIK